MTQNVFGPPRQSIFEATRYQGEYVTLSDVNEIVFTYTGKVNVPRESGFWVPARRSVIVQLVATMRVPKAVKVLVTGGAGDISIFTFNPNVYVMTEAKWAVVPSGALGGFVRCVVDPGLEIGGEDLVVMLRFMEIS